MPSGYLLDMLADSEDLDEQSICWVLQERGQTQEEINHSVKRRRNSKLPRSQTIWTMARWFTLACTLIVSYFNFTGFYRLLHSEHIFKVPLYVFSVGCVICGFLIGFKLTSHLYLGSRTMLYCGFPVAIGFVDLETNEESMPVKAKMLIYMAINALVGVSLTLFPLMFIYILMD